MTPPAHSAAEFFQDGLRLRQAGRLAEAEAAYRAALDLDPRLAAAHVNLGNVLKDLGRFDEAAPCYRAALSLDPNFLPAHFNWGVLCLHRHDFAEAADAFARVVSLRPDLAAAHDALGSALMETGERAAAAASFRRAVHLAPQNAPFWANWAASLTGQTFPADAVDAALFQDLLRVLEQPTIAYRDLVPTILDALSHEPNVAQIRAAMRTPDVDGIAAADRLSQVPLLLRLMTVACLTEPEAEAMLTRLRRALLEKALAGEATTRGLPFAAALAQQCFLDEYVFAETTDEAAAVGRLQESVAALLHAGGEPPPLSIATLAAYRPLHRFPWAGAALRRTWPDVMMPVITQQIAEPFDEQALSATIRALTPIDDAVSQAVRAQYEENPYPRWTKPILHPRSEPIDQILRRLFPDHDLGDYRPPPRPEVLIAGCGTGMAALNTASRITGARILAVDLSIASLAYALRQTRTLGIATIDYAQADVLELGSLGRQFDIIESTGVLHHLADPLAGWRVLVGLLRPGGVMKIALYSDLARRGVVKARAMIAAEGYAASPQDIRRLRQEILAASSDIDPDLAALARFGDFYSLSECRDLLFHVEEHRFTLPQIEAALDALGLRFLGFELADKEALRRFRQAHSTPGALSSLALWHAFEQANPDTFAGMYQFWCRKLPATG